MAFRKRRSRFVMPARLFKLICEAAPSIVETLDSMETRFSYAADEEQQAAAAAVSNDSGEDTRLDWTTPFYTPSGP